MLIDQSAKLLSLFSEPDSASVKGGMERYRNPPIIERALVVHAPTIPEEKFQLLIEEWAQTVQEEFPHPETVTEWMFALLDTKGMPTQGAERQKLKLRSTFWKMHGAQKHKGIQVWNDKLALNLLGIPGDPHHFEDRWKWLIDGYLSGPNTSVSLSTPALPWNM